MSSTSSRPKDYASLAQTIEAPRKPAAGGTTAGKCNCRVELVEGSGNGLTAETHELLASRLRAAAIILLIGFAIFLARRFFAAGLTPFEGKAYLDVLHVAIVLMLAVDSLLICVRCPTTLKRLRTTELAIFGLPGLYFVLMQYEGIKVASASHNVAQAILVLLLCVIFWNCLIFTYAMFIPNSWRRAGAVIGAMAVAPVALMVVQRLENPLVVSAVSLDLMVETTLIMVIAGMAAIYGTHKINSLRREAFEARQLGHYRLKRLLGSGGMGEVYLAEHQLLKRPCAIKVIRPSKAADPNVLARFEREVQATARLTHWNTVEIFDYGRTADGTFFYVMEYLPGMTLAELVETQGPLSPERAIFLLRQVCDALHEAHQAGLVHRDIKPGNIFISQRGGIYDVVKLLDFGLVKPAVGADSLQLTQEGMITGSPLYMSPEQAMEADEPDARSDIYSLGAVAYFMLTGRPPFEGNKPLQVLFAHAQNEVVRPSQHRAEVPGDLEKIVLRCLAKKPEDRFASVDQLARALAACDAADGWNAAAASSWWHALQAPRVTAEPVGAA